METNRALVRCIGWTALAAGLLSPGAVLAQREEKARAIADTLIVIAAQQSYARRNCGYYQYRLENLVQPWIGIPNYPADEPDFLSPRLAVPDGYLESGYLRVFTPGATPYWLSTSCDVGSAIDFCYDSQPFDPGSGLPSYSGRSSGELYLDPTGTAIPCPVPVGVKKLSLPAITSPAPGSTLPGSAVEFHWSENDVPVSEWRLAAGSSPGEFGEYHDVLIQGGTSSAWISSLPSDGSIVYLRLWYRVADFWGRGDVTYRASGSRRARSPVGRRIERE